MAKHVVWKTKEQGKETFRKVMKKQLETMKKSFDAEIKEILYANSIVKIENEKL